MPVTKWVLADQLDSVVLATVRDRSAPEVDAPGLIRIKLGLGEVVVFAWDIPHSVARIRHGDPASADVISAGADEYHRAYDLFVEQFRPSQQRLPQADIQTALLARVIEQIAPQSRVWYYPEATDRSMIVMTNDDDWSSVEQFEALIAGLARYDATCTFFVVPGTNISPELIEKWEAVGHSFSVHPALASDYYVGSPPAIPQAQFVDGMIRENVVRHRETYGHPVRTLRNHIIRWSGYIEPARTFVDLGVRIEFNYFSAMPLPVGHLCGSGRPMRFVDVDGTIVDCYQQPTSWSEECLVHPEFNVSAHTG